MPASKSLYEAMARTIRRYAEGQSGVVGAMIYYMVDALCDDLKQDNIRFNRDKFMNACFERR